MNVTKHRLGDHRTHTVKRPVAVAKPRSYGPAGQDVPPQAANRVTVKIKTEWPLGKPGGQLDSLSYQCPLQGTSSYVDITIPGLEPSEVRLEKISQLGSGLVLWELMMFGDIFSHHSWREGLRFSENKQGCYSSSHRKRYLAQIPVFPG